MSIEIVAMQPDDYDEVRTLWENSDGVGLDASDERQPILRFLQRNPCLSLVARQGGSIVAAVLCGQDGRRGYMSHLAVAHSHRNNGIGRELVKTCLSNLAKLKIIRCNVRLFVDNQQGEQFWRRIGWRNRHDLKIMTLETSNP